MNKHATQHDLKSLRWTDIKRIPSEKLEAMSQKSFNTAREKTPETIRLIIGLSNIAAYGRYFHYEHYEAMDSAFP